MNPRLRRVTPVAPCPICHRDHYCSFLDENSVICMRVPSDRKTKDGTGYIHSIDNVMRPAIPAASEPAPKLSSTECTLIARQCYADMTDRRLEDLARKLGLSVGTLRALRVGWHDRKELFTFPMRDAGGRIIGIRTRTQDGQKFAIAGSRSGIFIPQDATPIDPSVLLITEGPTDCGAAIDLGFMAIGRPDAQSVPDLAVEYVATHRPERVVIIADDDSESSDVGWRGADALARKLIAAGATALVRVLTAPDDSKDLRGWLTSGQASHDQLAAHLEADSLQSIEVMA